MKNKKIFIIILLFILMIVPGCMPGQSLIISSNTLEKVMYVGDKVVLTTNMKSLTTGEVVEWESSDELVVTVTQDGLVEAINEGVANVTAILGSYSNIVIINVVKLEAEVEIEINGKQTVLINETITLTASCNKKETILWSSSDTTIASIDQDGVVRGIKPGVVTIKAYLANDESIYSEVVVLVRTGTGIQDVINNYINQNSYVTTGNYDLVTLNEKVVNMVKSVEKSVIGVSNYTGETGATLSGTGTGAIYKKEVTSKGFKYTVFTNHHVIEEATTIKVYLGDIDEYVVATLIKSDEELDIAIITFEHQNEYEPVKIGAIGSINNGDFVVAIGNPGGYTYYGSVTFGMVSCYNRLMEESEVVYVQHDAPINPGNSGGPLFNLNGEVIGINTLKLAASDIEGMGFAIALESFLDYLN